MNPYIHIIIFVCKPDPADQPPDSPVADSRQRLSILYNIPLRGVKCKFFLIFLFFEAVPTPAESASKPVSAILKPLYIVDMGSASKPVSDIPSPVPG
jgi:hypothetical protein